MARALNSSFYPVKSPRSRRIHAMAAYGSEVARTSKTVCDRPMKGWIMALAKEELNCPRCLLAIGWDCRGQRKRTRRR
jgi:hypothetical protein